MQNKPRYSIDSVDHALLLATLLQQEGSLRVSDAAERLGVSRSTAHRLLAMLVYRDFAEQDTDRRYQAGPVLRPAEPTSAPVSLLRRIALPHMQILVSEVRETSNLLVLVGAQARFVASAECDQLLRVGDRTGRVLPAHLVSGGKAMLAHLPSDKVSRLYPNADTDGVNLPRLRRELTVIRKRGFAINDQLTEPGLTAIGIALSGTTGLPLAALTLAIPSPRFRRDRIPGWISKLRATGDAITKNLR